MSPMMKAILDSPPTQVVVPPHPALTTKAEPLDDLEGVDRVFDLMETLMGSGPVEGIGLAANQIGLPLRLIVVRGPNRTYRMVNPVIVEWGKGTAAKMEGCLSLPGVRVIVSRPRQVKVSWISPTAARTHAQFCPPEETQFEGMTARIVQHEIDHLDAILITDRARM